MEFWVKISSFSLKKSFACLSFDFLFMVFHLMYRGFPVWLKYVPGIRFRTDNEPFKVALCLKNLFSFQDLHSI